VLASFCISPTLAPGGQALAAKVNQVLQALPAALHKCANASLEARRRGH
jgi:hypothetical protein